MDKNINYDEMRFDSINRTERMLCDEYIYVSEICPVLLQNINIDEYIQINLDGEKVISRAIYHELLLLYNDQYRKYVASEVLNDIDRYGYYANETIESAISEVSSLLSSDLIDEFDDDMMEALNILDEANYKKISKRVQKKNDRASKWKNEK